MVVSHAPTKVFGCCQAAQALARRGFNVDRLFVGVSPGGVGQSLFSSHLDAIYGAAHKYFDPNVWCQEDEMRKQVPSRSVSVNQHIHVFHTCYPGCPMGGWRRGGGVWVCCSGLPHRSESHRSSSSLVASSLLGRRHRTRSAESVKICSSGGSPEKELQAESPTGCRPG